MLIMSYKIAQEYNRTKHDSQESLEACYET